MWLRRTGRRDVRARVRPSGIDGPEDEFRREQISPSTMIELFGACSASARRRGCSTSDAQFVAASRVASPHITVTRDAKAPMPLSMRSVWPWMTLILRVVDAERIGTDLRDRRLDALTDRGDAGDDFRPHHLISLLCGRYRTGQGRSSRRTWQSRHRLFRPCRAAFRQLFLQIVPTRQPRAPCRAGLRSRRSCKRSRCRSVSSPSL